MRRVLVSVTLPRAADGRLILTADVSPWLRPDAATSDARSFCHTYGRGENKHLMIPGWPYSWIVALETSDLPVELLGRLRSDRVVSRPASSREEY